MTAQLTAVVTDDNVWPWLREDTTFADHGVDARFVPLTDTQRLKRHLATADTCVSVFFPADLARSAGHRLRLLQITVAGTDQIAWQDLPATVTVANSFGHGRSVAEHVLMTVLAARRHLLWHDARLRRGHWHSRLADPEAPTFRTLPGTTAGIVGLGHMGRSIARLCSAVGMRPIGIRRSAAERSTDDPDLAWVDGPHALPDLLGESAVLVLACPLDDTTRHLIGATELDLLGPDALLVNVGRGALVQERCLYEALRTRRLGAAALDVWTTPAGPAPTPPSPLPFHELTNVIMTPHYSATAEDTYRDRAREVADNLTRLATRRPLRNVIRTGEAEATR
ncbi:2-hydroxyacid dehydrogenase [Streptomyces sp. S465]|uniref:2-hydroxyacid dehydrogenase n=1 Tax=Streptomyces sp. S465 TaxID=2979468 RepID=UPI0022A865C5|nr:2-hydroxyacid dehydrogenase [Streptomyces sp. S465]WAP53680.1 2-hydroxyacid dehydrogenase [Streptomyces sp. S465]